MKTQMTQIQLMIVWLLVMLLGGLGLLAVEAGFSGLSFSLLLLAAAVWKIQLIYDWFMGLRETRRLWRLIMFCWTIVVIGLISIAFALTPLPL